ncbi:MAG: hypothetical protein LBH73_02700 [Spirochaetaceae bacterium]|nr:hypothetical protein [Spirochaetaceae bacterium]
MRRPHKHGGRWCFSVLITGFLLCAPALGAQESILLSYQRNFVRANLATKAGILRDAATDERASDFIGPLYEYALEFCLQQSDFLRDDPDMIALAVLASAGARDSGHRPSVDTLWKLFQSYRDSLIRVEILRSLGVLGRGNPQVVENLNQFLANQNNVFRSGMAPDYPTLSACIEALSALGDGSSFPVLFSTMMAAYPESIRTGAQAAMSALSGDYKSFLIMVIQRNPPAEKLTAFNAARESSRFSSADMGEIAEAGLRTSLDLFPSNPEGEAAIQTLRFSSVRLLGSLKWARAVDAVIKHFYRVQTDYNEGRAAKAQLLEAVSCLGALDSSEAAQTLALQLGLFNSQMERTGEYDAEILTGVINALGELGDKIAFDYLLYIGYLGYPEEVQSAARDALNRLTW